MTCHTDRSALAGERGTGIVAGALLELIGIRALHEHELHAEAWNAKSAEWVPVVGGTVDAAPRTPRADWSTGLALGREGGGRGQRRGLGRAQLCTELVLLPRRGPGADRLLPGERDDRLRQQQYSSYEQDHRGGGPRPLQRRARVPRHPHAAAGIASDVRNPRANGASVESNVAFVSASTASPFAAPTSAAGRGGRRSPTSRSPTAYAVRLRLNSSRDAATQSAPINASAPVLTPVLASSAGWPPCA